jgi:cyclic beta-1,2-glucan synthetase
MEANGWTGRYGFYESVDFTERPGAGRDPEVVRAYMAHHQAMGMLALCNTVLGGPMRERFHRDPLVQSTEYLLQERLPALLEVTDEQQKLSLEFRLPAAAMAAEKA